MEYTFVKVRGKSDDKGGYWLFKPSSEAQLIEHWEKYAKPIITAGTRNIVQRAINGETRHPDNEFELAVESIKAVYPTDPPYVVALRLENEAFETRRNSFIRGDGIYLNSGLQVVMIDTRFSEVVETVKTDVLTFPDEEKPSESDVKYIKWPGGYHFYAKIGKLDVVDKDGNQKWSSAHEAEEAARWFIAKYYN